MAYSLGTLLANIVHWFKQDFCLRFGHDEPIPEFSELTDSAYPGTKKFDLIMTCRRCGAEL